MHTRTIGFFALLMVLTAMPSIVQISQANPASGTDLLAPPPPPPGYGLSPVGNWNAPSGVQSQPSYTPPQPSFTPPQPSFTLPPAPHSPAQAVPQTTPGGNGQGQPAPFLSGQPQPVMTPPYPYAQPQVSPDIPGTAVPQHFYRGQVQPAFDPSAPVQAVPVQPIPAQTPQVQPSPTVSPAMQSPTLPSFGPTPPSYPPTGYSIYGQPVHNPPPPQVMVPPLYPRTRPVHMNSPQNGAQVPQSVAQQVHSPQPIQPQPIQPQSFQPQLLQPQPTSSQSPQSQASEKPGSKGPETIPQFLPPPSALEQMPVPPAPGSPGTPAGPAGTTPNEYPVAPGSPSLPPNTTAAGSSTPVLFMPPPPNLPFGVAPAPAPVLFTPPANIPPQGKFIPPWTGKSIRRLMRGVHSLRDLVETPQSESAMRQLMDMGRHVADILQLSKFPVFPLFEARSDTNLIRDRSFGSYEYRHFGGFQVRLDGWVKPVSKHVQTYLDFTGKWRSKNVVRGDVSQTGPLSGTVEINAFDIWGRPWNLRIEMQGMLLNDDGMPSGGKLRLTGVDPLNRANLIEIEFPMVEAIGETRRKK